MVTTNNSLLKGVEKNIYGFYDLDLGITEIFTIPNDAIAIRTFTELCNNKQTPLGKYYEKQSLVKLGSYNDRNGELKPNYDILISGKQVVIPDDKK